MTTALMLTAAVLTTVWGTAHLFPTRSVVRGFGEISAENQRVITMEWILEGVTLIFVGALTAAVTLLGDPSSTTATVAYLASAGLLAVMAAVSLLTAGRNEHIAYRLCAPNFTPDAASLVRPNRVSGSSVPRGHAGADPAGVASDGSARCCSGRTSASSGTRAKRGLAFRPDGAERRRSHEPSLAASQAWTRRIASRHFLLVGGSGST